MPPPEPITGLGWLRVGLRAPVLVVLVFGGLLLLLALRLIEQPLFGLRRPLTPHITRVVCRSALWVMGLRFERRGTPMQQNGGCVANHSSWIDIFALNASKTICFVSKAEVARWPGIGWLARATGTVFIERNAARAKAQTALFAHRLLAGHKLLFFPEGTSTDGLRVLPFKTTLFEAFFDPDLKQSIAVQPITVNYTAPPSKDVRFFGWWGEMGFGEHLLPTLAAPRGGGIEVVYHAPLPVRDYPSRKALAKASEARVRAAHRHSGQGAELATITPEADPADALTS